MGRAGVLQYIRVHIHPPGFWLCANRRDQRQSADRAGNGADALQMNH